MNSNNQTSPINCRFFAMPSGCRDGDNCKFAHTADTLNDKPPLYKMQPCRNILQGLPCTVGADCTYAHPEDKPIKTKYCSKLAFGYCPLGPDKCLFWHPEDAKNPALTWLKNEPEINTKIQRECPHLANGHCQDGVKKCRYLHPEDLVKQLKIAHWYNGPVWSAKKPHPKTLPCKNMAEKGECSYGLRCHFAHPDDSHGQSTDPIYPIRPNSATPPGPFNLYKTKPCKNFAEKGECPYGQKCNFLHPDDPQAQSYDQPNLKRKQSIDFTADFDPKKAKFEDTTLIAETREAQEPTFTKRMVNINHETGREFLSVAFYGPIDPESG